MGKNITSDEYLAMQERINKSRYVPLVEKRATPPAKLGRKTREENTELIINDNIKQDTNSLTKACINYLNVNGFKVWRNGNHAVYSHKRKSYLKPTYGSLNGVPDIIGFKKLDGSFIGVEIKTGKDKLSDAQKQFQKECEGVAHYLVIHNIDELINYFKK